MSERFQKFFFPVSIFVLWLIFASKALLGNSIWISDIYVIETFVEYFPFKEFIKYSYLHGYFPLWVHNNECGFPFAAFPQTGSFYPLNPFFLLFDYVRGLNYYSFVHALFASYCGYWAGRELNFSRFASWVLALCCSMIGFPLFTAGCIASLTSNYWVPAVFLFSLRLTRKPGLGNFLGTVLCLSLQFLASEPEMFIYENIYIFFFLLLARRAPTRNILIWVLAAGVSWLAASIQVLPTADLIFHSYRRITAHEVSPSSPGSLLLPLGILAPGFLPYGEHLVPSPAYLSFMVPLGIFFAWENRQTRRGLYVMSFFALIIWVLLINPWPLRNLGAVGFVAPDSRYKLSQPFQFWMLIVAASGIDYISRGRLTEKQLRQARNIILVFTVYTLLIARGVLWAGTGNLNNPSIFLGTSRLIFLCVAASVLFLMALFRQKDFLKNSLFIPLLALLFLSDIIGSAWKFRPDQPTQPFLKIPASAEFLYRQNPLYRFRYASLFSTYVAFLDEKLVQHLDLKEGPGYVYSLFRVGLYRTTPVLVESAEGGSNMGINNINAGEKPLMDMLGIRYIVANTPSFWGIDPYPLNFHKTNISQPFKLEPGQKKKFKTEIFPGDRITFRIDPEPANPAVPGLKIYSVSGGGSIKEIPILPQSPEPSSPHLYKAEPGASATQSAELIFENSGNGTDSTALQISEAYIRNERRPFHLIFSDGVRIYENTSAWPRYFLTQAGNESPGQKASLPQVEKYASQEIELKVHAAAPSRLAIMESFFPGWKAFVNGAEEKIYLSHKGFQAVNLQAGDSKVRLVYAPVEFEIGLWFSLASLFWIAVLVIYFFTSLFSKTSGAATEKVD